MGRISKQVGWSQESYLLYDILEEIKKLQGIVSKLVTYPVTTSTTTITPTTTTTTTTV